MKRQLRNMQTLVPWVRPFKFGLYNFMTRQFGLRIDPDFLILNHLPTVRSVLDVGGNWGQSIYAVRRLRPEAEIASFEPNPILAERLARSFAADSKVTIHNLALSSQRGTMTLHVPIYRGFVYDGLASLDAGEAETWLNSRRVANFDPAKLSIRSFDVSVEQIDNLGLRPDFIKIDVQGHELAVLQGAENTLASAPVILLESVSEAIVDHLARFALKPYGLAGGELVENLLSTVNTVFMTDKTAESTGLRRRAAA